MSITYGDGFKLYASDCESLSRGAWLVEGVIHYRFTELQEAQERREASSSSSSDTANVLFSDPFIVNHLARGCQDNDDYCDIGKGLEVDKRDVVFMTISNALANEYNDENADSVMSNNGAHWSLLVVRRANDKLTYEHFDSCKGSRNAAVAALVAEKYQRAFLLQSGAFDENSEESNESLEMLSGMIDFKEALDAPQQSNGFDCGVYCLAVAEALSSLSASVERASLMQSITPESVLASRLVLYTAIAEKMYK
jgi:hypothetical protein